MVLQTSISQKVPLTKWPGTVTHTYNSSTLGGRGRQIALVQEFEISLSNLVKPHLYNKYKN